mgnify:CR=1 FL=1|tara:strand:+ start:1851 stop:2039 length:189 start_codon:yes stop_codon:yes gene_type:complete
MFNLLATASVLSCPEAQYLVQRIDPEIMTQKEYYELIGVLINSAPAPCEFIINIDHNFTTVN